MPKTRFPGPHAVFSRRDAFGHAGEVNADDKRI